MMKKMLMLLIFAATPCFAEDRAAIDAIDLDITRLQQTHSSSKGHGGYPNVAMCPYCKGSHAALMNRRHAAESAGAPDSPGETPAIRPAPSVVQRTGDDVSRTPANKPDPERLAAEALEAKKAEAARAVAQRRANMENSLILEAARPSREAAIADAKAGRITKAEALVKMREVSPARSAVVADFKAGKITFTEAMNRLHPTPAK